MSTSGVYNLAYTFDQAADEVFDILQIGADGETLSGDMIARFKRSANLTLKEWQTAEMHLWTETEGTLFLKVGQESYDFRDSTTHTANTWYETTTTAATTAGATSFTVTSVANIQDGDVIGIIQNDNNLFWTTVNGTPSGLTVNVDDAITLATVSGAYVRNYRPATATSPDLIPISKITEVRRSDEGYEIPIIYASRKEYFGLPNKETTGTPIQAYYSRQDIAGQDGGIMYLWNSPSSSVPVINFTYERKIQIMVNGTETLDIPDYAQLAFFYDVAKKLLSKFGASVELAEEVKMNSAKYMNDLLAHDSTPYPIKVKVRG